jgi:hypothetical protein
MAYVVTASVAVNNAAPKKGQSVIVTATVDNSGGTIPIHITGVRGMPVTPEPGFPGNFGKCKAVVSSMAGVGASPVGTAIAAGASGTFTFEVVLFAAGATTVSCEILGTRDDTGALITVFPSAAVTITAS